VPTTYINVIKLVVLMVMKVVRWRFKVWKSSREKKKEKVSPQVAVDVNFTNRVLESLIQQSSVDLVLALESLWGSEIRRAWTSEDGLPIARNWIWWVSSVVKQAVQHGDAFLPWFSVLVT